MLLELNIRNFALIDQLRIRFGSGFNTLTGETGAGKSIVIDAINAILGERMGADVVRSGADRATIEAAFELEESEARRQELAAQGALDPDESLLAVSRDITANGRSQCRVGGRLGSVSLLREVGQNLVDLHGQHEHQSLLNTDRHQGFLDDWCGPDALELRDRCEALDRACREIARQLSALQAGEREKAQRLDLLKFQYEEIEAARLKPGEMEELQKERQRLANMERLMDHVAKAHTGLSGETPEAPTGLDLLARVVKAIEDAARDDPSLRQIQETLQGALLAAQDAAQELGVYQDGLESNPERLEEVEERVALLRSLERKYGEDIESILAYQNRVADELSAIESAGEREQELRAELEGLRGQLASAAGSLSLVRKAGARQLEDQIGRELSWLALGQAQFEVAFEAREPGASGSDHIEFLFSANPGEPLRPLARIASGGEMSRIMLALKSLLSQSVGVPTVIFDEIDVGVGGRTGEAIGEKLAALGRTTQVICVTHLPQIAALADHHFSVEKEVVEGRTRVQVRALTEEERVVELSRMLGGSEQTARRHARDLRARRPASLEAPTVLELNA